jgi:hypothetical protein
VSVQLNGNLPPRYAYEPTALLVAALALGTGLAARAGLGAVAGGTLLASRVGVGAGAATLVMAIVVGLGFAASFRVQSRSSYGPDVTREIQAITTCSPGSTVPIRISPIEFPTYVPIPCDRLSP